MSDKTQRTKKRDDGTGSLRLRGGRWSIRYRHPGKLIEEATHLPEAERARAEKLLRSKLKTAGTPQFIEPAQRKLPFEALLALLIAEHRRKANRSRIGAPVQHLAAFFDGWSALAIRAGDVDRYVAQRRAAGAKPATINRELAALRRAFRVAIAKHELPSAWVPAIALLPEHNARQGFVDPPELEAFLAELRQRDAVVADVTECAYFTMLRRGNVLALTWKMIRSEAQRGQLVGGELRVPGTMTKNKRDVVLPLTGRLLDVFARRWRLRVPACPYVFHRAGKPVARFDVSWRAAAAAIGHPDLLFHDLRRSGARTLRRAGVDQSVIMARGGWKTESMFRRYAITDDQDQREAQAKLDAAFAMPGRRTVVPLRRRTDA